MQTPLLTEYEFLPPDVNCIWIRNAQLRVRIPPDLCIMVGLPDPWIRIHNTAPPGNLTFKRCRENNDLLYSRCFYVFYDQGNFRARHIKFCIGNMILCVHINSLDVKKTLSYLWSNALKRSKELLCEK